MTDDLQRQEQLWKEYFRERSNPNRNAIVEEYAPLVKRIVKMLPYIYMGYAEENDLYAEGIIGLINAVEKFDPQKNVKFETYATLRVRGAIIDYIRRKDVLSRTSRRKQKEINEFIETCRISGKQEPSEEEIAAGVGTEISEVRKTMEETSLSNMISFESYIEEEGDVIQSKDTSLSPEFRLEQKQLRERLSQSIDSLKEKDKVVLSLYYYEELTLKEIASVLELSESRISQILSRVMLILKEKMQSYV